MIAVCALKPLLPLLTVWALTGVPDAVSLQAAADANNVPHDVMLPVALVETRLSLDPTVRSNMGAVGRMQILPRVWRHYSRECWNAARDYADNVACGAQVLRHYANVCADDWPCATALYYGLGRQTHAYITAVERARGRLWWRAVVAEV